MGYSNRHFFIFRNNSFISVILLVLGKAEGSVARELWHGHVTAISITPEYRRLGLAGKLMNLLEEVSEK